MFQNTVMFKFAGSKVIFNMPPEFPTETYKNSKPVFSRLGADIWLVHIIINKKECWHLFLRNQKPEIIGVSWYIIGPKGLERFFYKGWKYVGNKPIETTKEELDIILTVYMTGSI